MEYNEGTEQNNDIEIVFRKKVKKGKILIIMFNGEDDFSYLIANSWQKIIFNLSLTKMFKIKQTGYLMITSEITNDRQTFEFYGPDLECVYDPERKYLRSTTH